MTLPGEKQNQIHRGTLRYRMYDNVELGIFNVDLAAGATHEGNAICVEGYRHFQIWLHSATPPTPLDVKLIAIHPVTVRTTASMLIAAVTILNASNAATRYFGQHGSLTSGGDNSQWRMGRFVRIVITNTGANLEQGIQGYLEATG